MQRGITTAAFRLVILAITLAASGFPAPCTDVETASYRRLIANVPAEMNRCNCGGNDRPSVNALVSAGSEAVPELIRALDDRNDEVVKSSLYILREIGPEAQDAVPRLIKLSRDRAGKQPMFAYSAFNAAVRINPAEPELIGLARDLACDHGIYYVTDYLSEAGAEALPAIKAVIDAMTNPPVDLLSAYINNGGDLIEVEEHLIRGINAPETYEDVRQLLIEEADQVDGQGMGFEPDTSGIHQLKSHLDELSRWAKSMLNYRAGEYDPLMKKWYSQLDSTEGEFHLFIIRNLWQLGPDVLPDLKRLLESGTHAEKRAAFTSCRMMGDDAAVLASEIGNALTADCEISRHVCKFLITLGDAGVDALVEIARKNELLASQNAIDVLRENAETVGPEIVELMLEFLEHNERNPRTASIRFFNECRCFREEMYAILPKLVLLIDHEDKILEKAAFSIYITYCYGGASADFVPDHPLSPIERAAQEDPNRVVRERAREMLDPEKSALLEEELDQYYRHRYPWAYKD